MLLMNMTSNIPQKYTNGANLRKNNIRKGFSIVWELINIKTNNNSF